MITPLADLAEVLRITGLDPDTLRAALRVQEEINA